MDIRAEGIVLKGNQELATVAYAVQRLFGCEDELFCYLDLMIDAAIFDGTWATGDAPVGVSLAEAPMVIGALQQLEQKVEHPSTCQEFWYSKIARSILTTTAFVDSMPDWSKDA